MSNGRETTRRLTDLLRDPRETPEVELKGWLNIAGNNRHKATLAKELIALANHGGGYVVLGLTESEDGIAPEQPRPESLATYTSDTVNSIVRRYAEPQFHCNVHIVASPDTGLEHPVVVVPGGCSVPIRSRRNGPDGQVIQQNVYYVRRPGPNSEPPQSGQEWDALIRRCITNAREDLLDQFRTIMAGGAGTEVAETDLESVHRWLRASMDRWRKLADRLPEGHGARLNYGHYAVGYQIVGDFDPLEGIRLREMLQRGCVRYTGWPPFWVPTRDEIAPYIYHGNVECWLGHDQGDCDPAHSDYWRVSPRAEFFLIRGYQEDAAQDRGIEPGTLFDLTLPVWRIGEVLLHAASMAREFGAYDGRIVLVAEWNGLAGRRLATFANPMRFLLDRHTAVQDTYSADRDVQISRVQDGLPELVDQLVRPLYELFDFFALPQNLATEELARMRERRL